MPKPASIPAKRLAVASVDAFVAGGMQIGAACLRAGVSRANYYKWKDAGSEEPRAEKQRGRPTLVELTQEEIRRLRYWRLVRDSVPLALQEFLRDELCRPEIAEAVRGIWERALARHKRPSWPMSIRRALHVTDAERAVFRGEKAIREIEVTERRGNFIVLEDGSQWPNTPGTIYSSDDESENQPFRYFDPSTGTERLGRQSLKTIENASHKWLGFTHVGRERDAYRVEDIADHFRDVVTEFGLPLMWRVERGVWDNNWLFGVECDNGKRWGSMEELFHIRQKFSSRGKADIEGAFNHSQDRRAHGPDGGVTSIGRYRGEFQQGTKEYLRAQAGDADALRKFWSIHESAEAVAKALAEENQTPKQNYQFGNRFITPDTAYGSPAKREVPADKWWLFCPVKKQKTVVQGAIEIKVPHYSASFRFRVNGAEGMPFHLTHGHRVLVAFHPGHPEQGMHIFNNDETSLNREGFSWGELIGLAEWLPDRAQEDLSGQGNFDGKKRERAAVRREFRAIVAGTARAVRKSHAQDGLGNTLRTASGSSGTPAKPARSTRGGMLLPEDFKTTRRASPEPVLDRHTPDPEPFDPAEERRKAGAMIF
jgi:hypothetical protein